MNAQQQTPTASAPPDESAPRKLNALEHFDAMHGAEPYPGFDDESFPATVISAEGVTKGRLDGNTITLAPPRIKITIEQANGFSFNARIREACAYFARLMKPEHGISARYAADHTRETIMRALDNAQIVVRVNGKVEAIS